jgi:hypothetical protein
MHMRLRTSQAVLLMLVSCTLFKFACQAALLPSALLAVVLFINQAPFSML